MSRNSRNGEGLEWGGGVIVIILGNIFSVVGPLSVYLVVESCAWGNHTNEKRRPLKETNVQQHVKHTKELSWYISVPHYQGRLLKQILFKNVHLIFVL